MRESATDTLAVINKQTDPLIKSLLALALLPYLQLFEDGNKRLGRLVANAVLIHHFGQIVSLRHIEAKQLALAIWLFMSLTV